MDVIDIDDDYLISKEEYDNQRYYVNNIQLLPNNIHNENCILTCNIENINNESLIYTINLNNSKLYESEVFTEIIPINYEINNDLFVNKNNEIIISVYNKDNSLLETKSIYVSLHNNVPIGVLQLDKIETHKSSINLTSTLTDNDLDKISYRIFINNNEILPWSVFKEDPYIDYLINYKQLKVGQNSIKVEFKDNYRLEGLGSWEEIITLTNQLPEINNLKYENSVISCNINDLDDDMIQCNIYLNDKKAYPSVNDYTILESLSDIIYSLNRDDIKFNKENKVVVNIKDEFDAISFQEITFIGEYIGLMFSDESKEHYTTDMGELIKYLNFGIITLGQTTPSKKVIIQNKYGLSLKELYLKVNNSLSNIKVQLSKMQYPFIPLEELKFEKEYSPSQEEEFYIRIESTLSTEPISGEFKIFAKGILM